MTADKEIANDIVVSKPIFLRRLSLDKPIYQAHKSNAAMAGGVAKRDVEIWSLACWPGGQCVGLVAFAFQPFTQELARTPDRFGLFSGSAFGRLFVIAP